MGNIIKYSESTSPNSIKSGNFNVGVNNTPTDLTGFFDGISPIIGGYIIYNNKESNGPSIYAPKNDTELIQITNSLGGSVETAAAALAWINSQSTMTVINNNYPSIVTDGLVLNVDAGFVSSYPKTGTTWRDLSGNGYNGTLVNGVSYSSENDGTLVFDGVDDRIDLGTQVEIEQEWTQRVIFKNTASTQTTSFRAAIHGNTSSNALGFFRLFNDVSGDLSRVRIVLRLQDSRGIIINLSMYPGPFSNSYVNYQEQDSFWVNRVIDLTITFSSDKKYRIYINGVLPITSTNPNTRGTDLGNGLYINRLGVFQTSSEPLNGNIYMSSFYNRALSSQEIQQNYQAGLQRLIPTNGLVLSLDAQNTNLYGIQSSVVYDVSGNDNNCGLINAIQYVSDGDGSWKFDGTNQWISTPFNRGILGNQTTLISWYRYNGVSSRTYTPIFGGVDKGGTEFFIGKNVGNTNIGVQDGNYISNFVVGSNAFDGNYHLIVYSYDNGTGKIYLDGELKSTGSFTKCKDSEQISIGFESEGGGYYFIGNISQVQIYNRVLTATEITTIYNATKSRYGL